MATSLPLTIAQQNSKNQFMSNIYNALPLTFQRNANAQDPNIGALGLVCIQPREGIEFLITAKPTIFITKDGKIIPCDEDASKENQEIMKIVLIQKGWLDEKLTNNPLPYIDINGQNIPSFKYQNLGYKWALGLGALGFASGLVALKAEGIKAKMLAGCSSVTSIMLATREFRLNKIYNWKQLENHPKPKAQNAQNELSLLQRIYQYNNKAKNPLFEESLDGFCWAGNCLIEDSKQSVIHALMLLENTKPEMKNQAIKLLAAEFIYKLFQSIQETQRQEERKKMKDLATATVTVGDLVNSVIKKPFSIAKKFIFSS